MTTLSATGFLFDSDGVLVDSLESAAVAWDAWSATYAPHYSFRRDAVHGVRAGDTVAELVAPELRERAERELERLEIDNVDGTGEILGAGALLRSLPDGRWAVVTSAVRELATARLGAAGLPSPTLLVTAEDVAAGKPDPECYRRGAEAIGVDPRDCVVFEDAPAGIRAALAAGVGTIVGVGGSALDSGATVVVPDLTAVSFVDNALSVDDAKTLG